MKSTSGPVMLTKHLGKHLFGPYLKDVRTRNTRLEWIGVCKRDLNTRQERDVVEGVSICGGLSFCQFSVFS